MELSCKDELRVAKMKPKDAIDLAYLEERYRAVTKNPFRIVQVRVLGPPLHLLCSVDYAVSLFTGPAGAEPPPSQR